MEVFMCNKTILAVIAICFLSFTAYADEDSEAQGLADENEVQQLDEETDTQKFYDRELLTDTLTADDKDALESAKADLMNAEDALAELSEGDEGYEDALQDVETAEDAVEEADESLTTELADTEIFVEGLTEEQVFALNRSLNNAVNSGLLVDIDSEDLALLDDDANKHQINAFTQAFEQEARFELKADKFADKYEETGNEKFLEHSDRMEAKGEDQKAKFLTKMDSFDDSATVAPHSFAKSEAKKQAKANAKASAREISKGAAKRAARQAAKDTAKATARQTAKDTAKATARQTAKDTAKATARQNAKKAAKKG